MDTLLIPLDYSRSNNDSKEDSPKKRLEELDKKTIN